MKQRNNGDPIAVVGVAAAVSVSRSDGEHVGQAAENGDAAVDLNAQTERTRYSAPP